MPKAAATIQRAGQDTQSLSSTPTFIPNLLSECKQRIKKVTCTRQRESLGVAESDDALKFSRLGDHMPLTDTFSQYVQGCIDNYDEGLVDELDPEERKEHESEQKLVKAVVRYLLGSRETVVAPSSTDLLAKFEALVQSVPDLVAHFLDEHYTRQLIGEVPAYVRRTLEFSRMEAERIPSEVTNTYLREATRAYIFALPQASAALSRAALEQSLKETLGRQGLGEYISFQRLVDEGVACNVLDKTTAAIARKLAKDGDEVLHEKPTDLKRAKDVLVGMRGLVQQIYSSKGGY